MSKREDKRKLELKRLRLRRLTDDQVAQVIGGYDSGRIQSRCCDCD